MNRTLYTLIIVLITSTLYGQDIIVVKDADVGAGVTNWTARNEYHLDGYIFVEDGSVLNIEAGTVIKGLASPSTGDVSSALIVARGGQLFAIGTEDAPIVFTAEFDDINDPADLNEADKGLWGGIIILGAATVGVDGGVQNVEGIPSTEGRAEYGGTIDNDNSGVLRYISIRHGGSKLEANNEINGLTLGGVGSETEIDYIEVFANLDDGIELFGGKVDVKHAVVSFCGDDSFDYDQSWDGRGQFWFSLQNKLSNRGGEWDGSESADLQPKASPVISNATFIGAGPSSENDDNNDAMRIRDDGAVQLWNSIVTDFAKRAIVLDNDSEQDSYQRFIQGDITFNNNVFYRFGAGSTFADIVSTDGGDDNLLINHLNNNGNVISDPSIAGISRIPGHNLDPRINADGAAYGKGVAVGDSWFETTSYIGAFDSESNWADAWTALAANGFFGDIVSAVDEPVISVIDETLEVFPNPVQGTINISFELESTSSIGVSVFDMMGRKIASPFTEQSLFAGEHRVVVDLEQIAPGTYLIALTERGSILGRRILIKQ